MTKSPEQLENDAERARKAYQRKRDGMVGVTISGHDSYDLRKDKIEALIAWIEVLNGMPLLINK